MNDDDDEVDADITPMIDIIFLLLIFFLLTTKFIAEEKVIASILPTTKGQAQPQPDDLEPPDDINVLVFPHDPNNPGAFARGAGGVEYFDNLWRQNPATDFATLRVGNADQVYIINGRYLGQREGGEAMVRHVAEVHEYLFQQLSRFETNQTPRSEETPIVLHCFSGMPWKYALLVYDAIRGYEGRVAGHGGRAMTQDDMLTAREVSFAPPRLRQYHEWEHGNELVEIIHMQ